MKTRPSILLFCAVVLVAIVLIIWYARKQTSMPVATPNVSPAQSATGTATTLQPKLQNKTDAVNISPPVTAPIMRSNSPADVKNGTEQWREMMDTQNTVLIVFYGRLEDQLGSPIVGAEVEGTTIIATGTFYGHTNVSTTSDINGFFTLDAGNGQTIGITPKKKGYAIATTKTSFDYSLRYPDHVIPDPNRPIVIKMWKLQGAEPLVSIHQDYKLRYTDAPTNFDLLSGQTFPSGGDLRITVNRPAGVISGSNPQDWSIAFEVIGGGFVETSPGEAGVTFFAPESGYRASGTFGKNNGPDLIDKMLFIQSRNGQVYSKVHLLFGINTRPDGFMNVTFDGVANTNGSRNWEAAAPQ